MGTANRNPRIELIRDAAVLQMKLLVDGLRDAVLIPVSLVAALIGVLRGGEDCGREFRGVIKLGRRSERWINLFGHQRPLSTHPVKGSMDSSPGASGKRRYGTVQARQAATGPPGGRKAGLGPARTSAKQARAC